MKKLINSTIMVLALSIVNYSNIVFADSKDTDVYSTTDAGAVADDVTDEANDVNYDDSTDLMDERNDTPAVEESENIDGAEEYDEQNDIDNQADDSYVSNNDDAYDLD